MFARVLYRLAFVAGVLALTAVLMKGFGLLQYVPGMGDAVFGAAHLLGIHGDEGVDDFYAGITGIVSLVIAILVVVGGSHLVRRRR